MDPFSSRIEFSVEEVKHENEDSKDEGQDIVSSTTSPQSIEKRIATRASSRTPTKPSSRPPKTTKNVYRKQPPRLELLNTRIARLSYSENTSTKTSSKPKYTKRVLNSITIDPEIKVLSMSFFPSEKYMFIGSIGFFNMYSTDTGILLYHNKLNSSSAECESIHCMKDEKHVFIVCPKNYSIQLWDMKHTSGVPTMILEINTLDSKASGIYHKTLMALRNNYEEESTELTTVIIANSQGVYFCSTEKLISLALASVYFPIISKEKYTKTSFTLEELTNMKVIDFWCPCSKVKAIVFNAEYVFGFQPKKAVFIITDTSKSNIYRIDMKEKKIEMIVDDGYCNIIRPDETTDFYGVIVPESQSQFGSSSTYLMKDHRSIIGFNNENSIIIKHFGERECITGTYIPKESYETKLEGKIHSIFNCSNEIIFVLTDGRIYKINPDYMDFFPIFINRFKYMPPIKLKDGGEGYYEAKIDKLDGIPMISTSSHKTLFVCTDENIVIFVPLTYWESV